MKNTKREKRNLRHARVRAKIFGTSSRPRAAVSRSLRHTLVQFIDDNNGVTLFSVTDKTFKDEAAGKTKSEKALIVGRNAAAELKKRKINSVVFDRAGFKYHGRVKAVAEGLREEGINV